MPRPSSSAADSRASAAQVLVDFRSPTAARWFTADYWQCRQRFLNLCDSHTLPVTSEHSPLVDDDELSTDSVWLGDQQAEKVMVLISGTHGVEGFCGSAVQRFILGCLQSGSLRLPENTAVLMIHALNPWGMQWARRCDHQGIDLNRNFIDFSQLPMPDPHYPELLAALSASDRRVRHTQLKQLADKLGQEAYEILLSGGQFEQAWAPFYGGQAPAAANRLIDHLINEWQLARRELVVIDLHTGLGPWGFGELISDHPAGSTANRFARSIFGEAVAETAKGESHSVPKSGLLDYRWHQLMDQRGCFLTLEFGTLGTESLFETIVEDHRFWRDRIPSFEDADYQANRSRMLGHFFPNDTLWQQAVLFKSWQVVERVLSWAEESGAS